MTPHLVTIICDNCAGSGEDPLYFQECRECLGYGSWEEVVDPVTAAIKGLREGNLGLTECRGDPFGPGSHPSDGAELHRLRSSSVDPYCKGKAA